MKTSLTAPEDDSSRGDFAIQNLLTSPNQLTVESNEMLHQRLFFPQIISRHLLGSSCVRRSTSSWPFLQSTQASAAAPIL